MSLGRCEFRAGRACGEVGDGVETEVGLFLERSEEDGRGGNELIVSTVEKEGIGGESDLTTSIAGL